MKVNIVIETSKDGNYSCYMRETLPQFGLAGFGETAEEAKTDMLNAYFEISGLLKSEGLEVPELEFIYHYDMKSFFNYFNFLNVSKVAEKAGINPSLMRKYTSGVAKAGEKQYEKLKKAIREFSNELQMANF